MKVALFFLGLVALGSSAPQPRKVFHEHFEDFVTVIASEVGQQLDEIVSQYSASEEFQKTLEFTASSYFKDLFFEMESLPEFKAMVDYLERDNIDILYFLDIFNEALENRPDKGARQSASGSNMSSFVNDIIAVFPKDKLAALFDQKMAEDDEFKSAMENLQSAEWQQIIDDLFASETFQAEIQVLSENGIDIHLVIAEIKAIFGQN